MGQGKEIYQCIGGSDYTSLSLSDNLENMGIRLTGRSFLLSFLLFWTCSWKICSFLTFRYTGRVLTMIKM